MLRKFKYVLFSILMIFILCLGSVHPQSIPTIELRKGPILQQNVQVIYFSNFDLLNKGTAQYLFDVTINNIEQDWPGTRIILEVELDNMVVASAESDLFTLVKPQSGNSWTASNIELINAQTFPGSGMTILFNNISIDPPKDSNFEDALYGSGKASSGQYKLRGRLENSSWQGNNPEVFIVLNITNPSNIQLSGPGNIVGWGTPQEVMTEFPVFAFFSDGSEFILSIYEKLSHHNSIEDVINSGNPIYQTDPAFPLTSTVLNYATANGQPLQTGSTYYWFVDVLVNTTAGVEKFRSEVYNFKIVEAGATQGENQAFTSVIEMLRPVVGNEADNLSKNLTNYELKTIRLNGKTITIYELQQIIENYEGHFVEISDLILY